MAYLLRNFVGVPVHISRGEAEQLQAGTNKVVLTTIVIDQTLTMVSAVIFDSQALSAVKQVWAA